MTHCYMEVVDSRERSLSLGIVCQWASKVRLWGGHGNGKRNENIDEYVSKAAVHNMNPDLWKVLILTSESTLPWGAITPETTSYEEV